MRKLFIPIEFLFYWLVIVTIFLLGPLFADAATDNLSIQSDLYYSFNNTSEVKKVSSYEYLQTFDSMHDDFIKKFTFNNGAYGYTQIHNYSDAKSNAFVSTDFISFQFGYNINYDLINTDYYYIAKVNESETDIENDYKLVVVTEKDNNRVITEVTGEEKLKEILPLFESTI